MTRAQLDVDVAALLTTTEPQAEQENAGEGDTVAAPVFCTISLMKQILVEVQLTETPRQFTEVCSRLEQVANDIFTPQGWRHSVRIGSPSP
jgi:hypothetical protein